MSSRPSSKFLSRPSTINPIKSSSSTTQPYENEAAVKTFQNAFKKSLASYNEPSLVAAAIDALLHIDSINDRLMGLEYIISFLSENADGILKDQVAALETKMVEILYDDLHHPPATYIGAEYQYRSADGSNNNVCVPEMGKASTPYARSVQQMHPISLDTLPDPGLVFDTLLKRQKFTMHPAGLSSMMFSWAALVIHTVFRTSQDNVSINETSSYVDLAPLYGNDPKALNEIRVHDGRGLMLPDTFAEDRLLLLPPAVCVLLVLFNRNHNYIASKLFQINERQTYKKPEDIPLDDPERPKKIIDQDEDIFQTARLINCGWFAAIIFSDYFGSILGLVRQGSRWSLNPFAEIRDSDHKLFERGRGNVCSVEFNLLYRWHATTSQADEQWATKSMDKTFPDKSIDEITVDDFKVAFKKKQAQLEQLGPSHWPIGDLQRGLHGKFDETKLAAILKDAIEQPAAAFGARGIPQIMRLQEIMGIEANRRWGACSLNEFRKFLGLKTYESFSEWNPDKEIADAAERLYTHIDRLELYVGLMAEDAKKPVEGAGLCPGYTISRAILSDAIALTRGDRFFTTDCTPYNLTAWGYADIQRDPKGPGNGNMLGRLFNRCLPGEFSDNSTYAWFPFQSPPSIEVFLRRLGTAHRYEFTRPPDRIPIAIAREYNDVQQILGSAQFRPLYGDKGAHILSGEGFFLASNKDTESQRDQGDVLRILGTQDQSDQIVDYFYEKTRELIKLKSYSLTDKNIKYVDIVRDVLRFLPVHWAATSLAGLTLKADKESWGDYTESQLYDMITDIYSFLFLDLDPSKAMDIEASAKEHIKTLQSLIRTKITIDAEGKLTIASLVGTIRSLFSAKGRKRKLTLAESLIENDVSVERTTNNVLSLLIGASVELSQSIISVVNFYVDMPDIVKQFGAADSKDPALEGYVYEAMRLDPSFRGVHRVSLENQTVGSLTFSKGQHVFVDLAHASLDPNVFPDPLTVHANREPRDRYLTGDSVTRSLGAELTKKIVTQVLRAVFECNGVSRAPGRVGHLRRFKVAAENRDTLLYEYFDGNNLPTAWPSSMLLQYNVVPPRVNGA